MSLPLCETWLEDSIKNDEVAIERYVLVHRDRNRHGGGIGMYIRESLSFSHFLIHPSIEFLLAFGSLPQHFHPEPTSARQGCRGLAQKLYHLSGNKTLLMLVSQLTEDSLHIRNVFRNEDINSSDHDGMNDRQLFDFSSKRDVFLGEQTQGEYNLWCWMRLFWLLLSSWNFVTMSHPHWE